MTQTRIHDYRGPRSSEDLNRKLVGLLAPGVYRGFHVGADGAISPGLLLTAGGVTVEEDEGLVVAVPPGDPTHPRVDLIPLCQGSCRLLGSAFLRIRQLTIGGVMERRDGRRSDKVFGGIQGEDGATAECAGS